MMPHHKSETAIAAALLRAAHQVLDPEPRILDDPISIDLVPGSSTRELRAGFDRFDSRFMRTLRASFVLRSKIAEDYLEKCIRRGVTQYVLVGAGFDSFAYRQQPWSEALQIFELDHPATQSAKIASLKSGRISIPDNLHACPIDLEREDLAQTLNTFGFDPNGSSFFSWLGVVPYLTEDAIKLTLAAIRSCGNRIYVAISYVLPDDAILNDGDSEVVTIASAAAAARGEPWLTRFHATEIESLLRSIGFNDVQHVDMNEVRHLFSPVRVDGLPMPGFEQIVFAS